MYIYIRILYYLYIYVSIYPTLGRSRVNTPVIMVGERECLLYGLIMPSKSKRFTAENGTPMSVSQVLSYTCFSPNGRHIHQQWIVLWSTNNHAERVGGGFP